MWEQRRGRLFIVAAVVVLLSLAVHYSAVIDSTCESDRKKMILLIFNSKYVRTRVPVLCGTKY